MSKLKLGKLDLSKNLITDAGFKLLGPGLAENISILQLILSLFGPGSTLRAVQLGPMPVEGGNEVTELLRVILHLSGQEEARHCDVAPLKLVIAVARQE